MHPSFKMPTKGTIKGRSSTMTNSFINTITPFVSPTDEEVKEVLKILGMDKNGPVCAYCGDPHSEWDHFRPLVKERHHTGYITEIANLVPSCHRCNSSKGNKDWDVWIVGTAAKSPKTRGVKNLDKKIKRLKKFENWKEPTKIDFGSIVGKDAINDYWKKYNEIMVLLTESQEKANSIKKIIEEKQSGSNTYRKKENIKEMKFNQNTQEKKGTKQQDVLKLLLRGVGMEIFVDYYYEFLDLSLSNRSVTERLPEKYTMKSRISRTSKARRIFREGLARKALEMVCKSEKINSQTIKKADEILKGYNK